jgi:hypothetical protein
MIVFTCSKSLKEGNDTSEVSRMIFNAKSHRKHVKETAIFKLNIRVTHKACGIDFYM